MNLRTSASLTLRAPAPVRHVCETVLLNLNLARELGVEHGSQPSLATLLRGVLLVHFEQRRGVTLVGGLLLNYRYVPHFSLFRSSCLCAHCTYIYVVLACARSWLFLVLSVVYGIDTV